MRRCREETFAFQAVEIGTLSINVPDMTEHNPFVSEVVGYPL
jgi:hypothetical protein